MSEIDKDYKRVKETVSFIAFMVILLGLLYMLWEWCRKKPIRFIIPITIILYLTWKYNDDVSSHKGRVPFSNMNYSKSKLNK